MVGDGQEPRQTNACRVLVAAARCVVRAPTEGQGGDDHRSKTTARMEDASIDAVLRTGTSGAAAGDHRDTEPVPDQAAALAVHRAGCGHALDSRSGVRRREAAAPAASTDDSWAEPQSQPGPEECVQGGSQCGSGQAGTTERFL